MGGVKVDVVVCGFFLCVGRGLATLLCFFMLRGAGRIVYGICHGRLAAECNMITNKQTNQNEVSNYAYTIPHSCYLRSATSPRTPIAL